ncbi:uncharacterized protein G2W53_014273 [Senna tora]|uniref:Uncharacterized protein n=1 Tax=Senna tora TaxID=362788 RepID=A0A834WT72_9FABA|nr:uncharacterized protein G2W53_014273 [Senna tora]
MKCQVFVTHLLIRAPARQEPHRNHPMPRASPSSACGAHELPCGVKCLSLTSYWGLFPSKSLGTLAFQEPAVISLWRA